MKPESHLRWVKIAAEERVPRRDRIKIFPNMDLPRPLSLFAESYWSCIDPETARRREFGKLLGEGPLKVKPPEHELSQRTGQLIYARMVVADYEADPRFGVAFRYAQIAQDDHGIASDHVISVDAFRKPLPFETIKEGAPDNIRMHRRRYQLYTAWRCKTSYSGDPELETIIHRVFDGCKAMYYANPVE